MSVKYPNKNTTFAGLGNVATGQTDLRQAALFPIDKDGYILFQKYGRFLLNPSSYEDSKSANWSTQQTPGQSDPVMQWTSSGPRTVTFDALVTADTFVEESKAENANSNVQQNAFDKVITAVGTIASSFFKVNTVTPRKDHTVLRPADSADISAYLNYYRSLLYPTYTGANNGTARLQSSPPLLVLYAGSAIAKVPYENRISSQHDLWVLTNLRIKITKQLPNLAPMEAVVSFQLVQYNIRSFDSSRFIANG